MIKNILITGSDGFIGKNLSLALEHKFPNIDIYKLNRHNSIDDLKLNLEKIDFIYHLAGSNRPHNKNEFENINNKFTNKLCSIIEESNKRIPIVFSSSTQASDKNEYGISKLKAEISLQDYAKKNETQVYIYRLNNIFGKWSKPNYNSVVATFCNNISKGLDIQINDSESQLRLTYIDDVVDEFISLLENNKKIDNPIYIDKYYEITVGELASQITQIKHDRQNHLVRDVGDGFTRALYATYLSYLEPNDFISNIKSNIDDRGNFVEMVKTEKSGQFSFFSAHPGVTRGSHYHHTKNEKFLVISGKAKFSFMHMITKDYHELIVESENPQIVETIPGWAHDITNVGKKEMLVMLWANEIFDKEKPDTFWEEPKNEKN